ncbi:hypothetical protein DFH07DRAFT_1018491 [Mycena maculata]|uniref:Uncharacterized protein n=1 Tax=Mycena maculata TaxID=230809 RepID=A0AAD7NJN3_9AGAR|nr:hypothetical protein DFH07DRAFT_1018491 [Mycena maculata]
MPATPARLSAPPLPHSPYRFNANNEVVDNPAPSAPSLPSVVAPATSDGAPTPPITHATGLERSLAELEAESHAIREAFTAEEQSDKATGPTYAHHVRNYEHWWNTSQGHRQNDDPSHTIMPAFPITAAKVTVFLEYEMTRPQKRKREDGTDSTATVGSSDVKQVISALENRRLSTQHNYLDNPAAQIGLHQDYRIQKLESAAEHKEPARVKMAHILKAKGTNADTFTSADVIKCSDWCLTDFKGPTNIWIGLRDRGMLLTSCSVAFRGDGTW